MAISPNSFFNTDASAILASNAERDRADARLSSDFQVLGATIIRLTSELGNFSKSIVSGQKQENKILDDYSKDIELKTRLSKTGIVGGDDVSSSIVSSTSSGLSGDIPNMSIFGGAALAGGGIAAAIAALMGGGEPDDSPVSSPNISGDAPAEIKALMEVISGPESGGNYEAMNPSTTLPGATKMTIAQVANTATGAVGRYQNMPGYLGERAKLAGLDYNKDLYNQANQDKMTRAHIASLLGGEQKAVEQLRKNPSAVARRLNRTWTSFPGGGEQQLTDQQFSQRYQSSLNKYKTSSQQSVSPAKPSSMVKTGAAEDTKQQAQPEARQASQRASSLVPQPEASSPMIAVVPTPSQSTSQPIPTARNSTQSSGSPDSKHWLSDIARLNMGIAMMG